MNDMVWGVRLDDAMVGDRELEGPILKLIVSGFLMQGEDIEGVKSVRAQVRSRNTLHLQWQPEQYLVVVLNPVAILLTCPTQS